MTTTLRLLTTALLFIVSCPCQGLIAPDLPQPPEQLRHPARPAVETGLLQVRTEIHDGAATTTLTQTLKNRTGSQQEAWWLLPLPRGALADRFTLTVGGVAMQGEVLDAHKARSIYEEIVRKRRDPGLLEYLGDGCLRARVFPIPPQGEVQIAVRYTQMLTPSDGVTTFRFPLRSAWLDGVGPEKLAFVVEVASTVPIKTVWSPLQEVAIARDGDHRLLASAEYARGTLPTRDFELHFGITDQDFGASVLNFRRQGEPGYFVVWLAPKRDWPAQPNLVRSVNLVIDTSGSMAGEKMQQARAAVRAFVSSLAPGDWFNVIPFSTDARPFFPAPVPADQQHRDEALAKVDQLEARGGTNIEAALEVALRTAAPDKVAPGAATIVPITVFLTDGLPTVGTTDVDALLRAVKAQNKSGARVFVLGVGHDVNTRLLDTLAQDHRGDRDYVQPGEDIERKTSSLFQKLSGPVMTDVRLSIDGLETMDLEPAMLPDLFVQGQLAVVGRYRGEGSKALRLRGKVGATEREYVFEATFPAANTANDWLPALWAQRKVAALLEAIRLHGQSNELVAEVTRLGKEFGIVTPFTSHLVVEESMKVAAARGQDPGAAVPLDGRADDRLRREWHRAGLAAPAADAPLPELQAEAKAEADRAAGALQRSAETGAEAVEQSVLLVKLARDKVSAGDGAVSLLHRRIGGRNFHLVQGVWVDAAFAPAMQAALRRVPAFSDDYFALLQQRPELASVLAFSTRMVVVDGTEAFEIVE